MINCTYIITQLSLLNFINHCGPVTRHMYGLALVQETACFLTAPTRYMNQCWLLIWEVLWHSHGSNFTGSREKVKLVGCGYISLTKITLISELRSSKKLLLVFSYDCPQHAYAVYRLCIYLMCRCGCDVSWTLPVAEMEGCHSEEWLLKQINVSDCVLILNSEPAYQRYTTRKNNVSIEWQGACTRTNWVTMSPESTIWFCSRTWTLKYSVQGIWGDV